MGLFYETEARKVFCEVSELLLAALAVIPFMLVCFPPSLSLSHSLSLFPLPAGVQREALREEVRVVPDRLVR